VDEFRDNVAQRNHSPQKASTFLEQWHGLHAHRGNAKKFVSIVSQNAMTLEERRSLIDMQEMYLNQLSKFYFNSVGKATIDDNTLESPPPPRQSSETTPSTESQDQVDYAMVLLNALYRAHKGYSVHHLKSFTQSAQLREIAERIIRYSEYRYGTICVAQVSASEWMNTEFDSILMNIMLLYSSMPPMDYDWTNGQWHEHKRNDASPDERLSVLEKAVIVPSSTNRHASSVAARGDYKKKSEVLFAAIDEEEDVHGAQVPFKEEDKLTNENNLEEFSKEYKRATQVDVLTDINREERSSENYTHDNLVSDVLCKISARTINKETTKPKKQKTIVKKAKKTENSQEMPTTAQSERTRTNVQREITEGTPTQPEPEVSPRSDTVSETSKDDASPPHTSDESVFSQLDAIYSKLSSSLDYSEFFHETVLDEGPQVALTFFLDKWANKKLPHSETVFLKMGKALFQVSRQHFLDFVDIISKDTNLLANMKIRLFKMIFTNLASINQVQAKTFANKVVNAKVEPSSAQERQLKRAIWAASKKSQPDLLDLMCKTFFGK